MKKTLSVLFIFSFVFVFGVQNVSADVLTAPVVSIGTGNGNTPVNNSPVSGETYNGQISVYATITDDDLDNYHFRIVKVGGLDGYTCTAMGALFAGANQGYASTTLLIDACGFVFNQSIYTAPSGFTNSLITTVNTEDIIAFGGEGDYWFILGAVDIAGNRTNSNYLNDARVRVTVSSTSPVVAPAPVAPIASTLGGGGNGPIANSYGSVSTSVSTNNSGNNTRTSNTFAVVPESKTITTNQVYTSAKIIENGNLADGGLINNDTSASAEQAVTTTEVSVSTTSNDNLAQAVSSGFNFNWLWIILAILGLGGIVYYFSRETK